MGDQRRKREAISQLATARVEAVWACVNVLRPDLSLAERKELARTFLDLGREDYCPPASIQITNAQVTEIVWRNFQCANRYCSAGLFAREIAEELNEFFKPDGDDILGR